MPAFKFVTRLLTLLLFFICFTVLKATAQCNPATDPFCDEDPDDPEVPLDNHVFYLIGGGLLIGMVYLRKNDEGKLPGRK